MKETITFEKNKLYMGKNSHRVYRYIEDVIGEPDLIRARNFGIGTVTLRRDELVPLPVDQAGVIVEELVYSDPEASGWYMLDFTMFGEDLSCPAYFNAGDKTWYGALKGEKPVKAIPSVDIHEWNPMVIFQR